MDFDKIAGHWIANYPYVWHKVKTIKDSLRYYILDFANDFIILKPTKLLYDPKDKSSNIPTFEGVCDELFPVNYFLIYNPEYMGPLSKKSTIRVNGDSLKFHPHFIYSVSNIRNQVKRKPKSFSRLKKFMLLNSVYYE